MLLAACNGSQNKNHIPLAERFDPETQSYAFAIPNLPPVPGIPGLRARDCGQCHQTIYQEWRLSTHATALRDIQFQAELAKPDSPKWICLNCHIPLQNQRQHIVTYLADGDIFQPVTTENAHFDEALQREAVTCATCHVRAVSDSSSVIIGPNGSQAAPHPVQQKREFLREMCQRCHNPQGEGLTPNLICWFETTRELADAQDLVKAEFGEQRDCVDCHMPAAQRRVADTFLELPVRAVNAHSWVGSGIPKWYDGYDHLLERGYQAGLQVEIRDVQLVGDDSVHAAISLKNAFAGHDLPTGDPERFLLVLAILEAADGKRLQQDSLKIGQEWLWSPARKIGDNRLNFGETRVWRVALPNDARANKMIVMIYNVRLKAENARHMMQTQGVNEAFLPDGQKLVQELGEHYPFAMVIYREEIDLQSGQRRRLNSKELIALSRLEKGKPLEERDY